MRSECKCQYFSCESTLRPNERFRFVKDNEGCITDEITIRGEVYKSGITDNSIAMCELKIRKEDKFTDMPQREMIRRRR